MKNTVLVLSALVLLCAVLVQGRLRPSTARAERAGTADAPPAGGAAEPGGASPAAPLEADAGRRAPTLGLLHGAVRGEGRPLGGVEVVLAPAGGGPPRSATTDARGAYELAALPPGTWSLSVAAAEPFPPIARTVEIGPTELRVDVDLAARFRLRVRAVQDAPEGVAPVAGARVALVPTDGDAPPIAAHCGADGEVELADVPAGRYALEVTADGLARFECALRADAERFARDAHLRGRTLVVRLVTPGPVLHGVVRTRGGEPVAGALVCLDERVPQDASARLRTGRPERDAYRSAPPHAVTGEDGAFELATPSGAEGASLLVCAARPGTPLVYRHPLPPDPTEVRVRLPDGMRLEVRCTSSDGSAADGTVELSDGLVTHDLTSDPVLARIPGVERWNLLERSPGRVVLDVLPGGYRVLHTPADGVAGREAFFVAVEGPDPQFASFTLGDG